MEFIQRDWVVGDPLCRFVNDIQECQLYFCPSRDTAFIKHEAAKLSICSSTLSTGTVEALCACHRLCAITEAAEVCCLLIADGDLESLEAANIYVLRKIIC